MLNEPLDNKLTSEEPKATANPLPILERIPKSFAIALIFSIPISFANLTATVLIAVSYTHLTLPTKRIV